MKKSSKTYPHEDTAVAVAEPEHGDDAEAPPPETLPVLHPEAENLIELSTEERARAQEIQDAEDGFARELAEWSHESLNRRFKKQFQPGFTGTPFSKETLSEERVIRVRQIKMRRATFRTERVLPFVSPILLRGADVLDEMADTFEASVKRMRRLAGVDAGAAVFDAASALRFSARSIREGVKAGLCTGGPRAMLGHLTDVSVF